MLIIRQDGLREILEYDALKPNVVNCTERDDIVTNAQQLLFEVTFNAHNTTGSVYLL